VFETGRYLAKGLVEESEKSVAGIVPNDMFCLNNNIVSHLKHCTKQGIVQSIHITLPLKHDKNLNYLSVIIDVWNTSRPYGIFSHLPTVTTQDLSMSPVTSQYLSLPAPLLHLTSQ